MIQPDQGEHFGHGRPDEGRPWPRRVSKTEEARRLLAARDTRIADYTRSGVTRTVWIANTTPRRADILRLREAHYRGTLAELGVPVWDDHDETAVHLLCTEGDRPVGSMRTTLNGHGRGDLYEDFEHLDELLADTDQFLVFARELVLPEWRGRDVATVLAHAGCLWWRMNAPVRRIFFTSIARERRSPSVFGATAVTPPVPLGPEAIPVMLFTAQLDTVIDSTASRLERTGWSVHQRGNTVTQHQPPQLPFVRDRPTEPPSCYRRLRRERPVCRVRMPSGDLAWLVTRFEDARFVLSDARFSKAALLEPDAPRVRPGALPPGLLFTTDPPEHTALRARARAALSRERLNAVRPAVVEAADELTDALRETPEADLVAAFAQPLAMRVMCRVLGVPEADRELFARWAGTVLAVGGFSHGEVERAQRDLQGYTSALVAARRAEPTDDLVSALVRDEDDDDSGAAAVSLAYTLLVTGYETMVAAVANSVLVLLQEGGMPTPWPADSGGLLDELLRLSTFGDALRSRRTTTEVRVGGVLVPAGDVVLVSLASANRDETFFPEPDRVLPGQGSPRHLAFGHGPHHCPGAGLARIELDVALERLATRFPAMRLAIPPEEVVLRTGSAESPPERLPVRLGAARGATGRCTAVTRTAAAMAQTPAAKAVQQPLHAQEAAVSTTT